MTEQEKQAIRERLKDESYQEYAYEDLNHLLDALAERDREVEIKEQELSYYTLANTDLKAQFAELKEAMKGAAVIANVQQQEVERLKKQLHQQLDFERWVEVFTGKDWNDYIGSINDGVWDQEESE